MFEKELKMTIIDWLKEERLPQAVLDRC